MPRNINHTVHVDIPLRNGGYLWVLLGHNIPYTYDRGPLYVKCIVIVDNKEIASFTFHSYLEFKRFKDEIKEWVSRRDAIETMVQPSYSRNKNGEHL